MSGSVPSGRRKTRRRERGNDRAPKRTPRMPHQWCSNNCSTGLLWWGTSGHAYFLLRSEVPRAPSSLVPGATLGLQHCSSSLEGSIKLNDHRTPDRPPKIGRARTISSIRQHHDARRINLTSESRSHEPGLHFDAQMNADSPHDCAATRTRRS